MALTDNCDIYLAMQDSGVNRVVSAVTRQRPSLVNLGTVGFVRNPDRLCEKIDAHPIVSIRGNPLVGQLPGLPVLLTPYSVEYCFQVAKVALDIHPGGIITLPPELGPLSPQLLAVQAAACFGYGCPSPDLVSKLPYLELPRDPKVRREPVNERERASMLAAFEDRRPVDVKWPPREPPREVIIPADKLLCTCIEIDATLGLDFFGPVGGQRIRGQLGGIEIVDLGPTSLEDSIECYLSLVVKLGLLPKLQIPLLQKTADLGLLSIAVESTPNSAAVPFNPALEDNQIKVFVDLQGGPGTPGPGGGSGGGGGTPAPPPDPGVVRARTRTGPFDATAALAERAVQELFVAARDGFSKSGSGSKDFGPFRLRYAAEVHLENGTIDFRPDGSIALDELDVAFNTLELCIGIDIPKVCIGGFCIVGIPFDGCLVHAPSVCFFEDDPDFEICLDLGPFLRIELSAALEAITKYAVNLARTPGMNDWDAAEAGHPNHWQLYIDPVSIDIDLFDIADIVGDLLEDAVDAAIDTFLGPLPGWAKDFVRAILGPVADVIRFVLDVGDDIEEWLSSNLGVSLGLFDFVLTAVGDYLAKGKPLIEIPEPFQILPADAGLVPVLLPIDFLGITVDNDEMVLGVDLGG